jgi:hypothetical protein
MATNEMPVPHDPTSDEALALFKAIEEKFPTQSLGGEKWYIFAVSLSLYTSSTSPETIATTTTSKQKDIQPR